METTTATTDCNGPARSRQSRLASALIGVLSLLAISYGEARFIRQAPDWLSNATVSCPVDRTAGSGKAVSNHIASLDTVPIAVLH